MTTPAPRALFHCSYSPSQRPANHQSEAQPAPEDSLQPKTELSFTARGTATKLHTDNREKNNLPRKPQDTFSREHTPGGAGEFCSAEETCALNAGSHSSTELSLPQPSHLSTSEQQSQRSYLEEEPSFSTAFCTYHCELRRLCAGDEAQVPIKEFQASSCLFTVIHSGHRASSQGALTDCGLLVTHKHLPGDLLLSPDNTVP